MVLSICVATIELQRIQRPSEEAIAVEILNGGCLTRRKLGKGGNVLVEFFATWCPHCQRMMPIINDVARRVQGQAVVYQVDIDQSPDLAKTYTHPTAFRPLPCS